MTYLRTFSFPLLLRTNFFVLKRKSYAIDHYYDFEWAFCYGWIFVTKLLLGKLAVYSTVFHRRHFLRLSTLLWNICCFARMWNDVRSSVTRRVTFRCTTEYTRIQACTPNLFRWKCWICDVKQLRRMFLEHKNVTTLSQPSISPLLCQILSTRCFGTLGNDANVAKKCKLSIVFWDIFFWEIYWEYEWLGCNVFTVICCHLTSSEEWIFLLCSQVHWVLRCSTQMCTLLAPAGAFTPSSRLI